MNSKYLFGLAALLIVGAMTVSSFNSVTSNPSSAQAGMKECISVGAEGCNALNVGSCEMGNCMGTVVFDCMQRGDFAQKDCPIIGGGGPCNLQQDPNPDALRCVGEIGSACNPDEIPPGGCICDCPGGGPAVDEVVWSGTVTDSNGVSDEILVSASGQVVSSNGVGSFIGDCIREQLSSLEKPLSCTDVTSALNSCLSVIIVDVLSSACGGGVENCKYCLVDDQCRRVCDPDFECRTTCEP